LFAAAVGAAAIAVALAPAPAEAQILFDTTAWNGTPTVTSTAAAITAFDALPAVTTGYGCALIATLDGANNQTTFTDGVQMNIAYHESAVFDVSASQAGLWSFRWGVDFGGGGTLVLDGAEIGSNWGNFYWNNVFDDPAQFLSGGAVLAAGTHLLEIFGFEDCCDGAQNAQFLPQMTATWQDVDTTNLTITPGVCGGPNLFLMVTPAPDPVLPGGQLAYTYVYESTGTASAPAATLTATVPANTTFVSATAGGTFDGASSVSWDLGGLAVGVSGSPTMTVAVATPLADGTTLTNTASLSATGATTVTVPASVTVSNALLSLGSTATPDPVMAGDHLTFTLAYSNLGSIAVADAAITDQLPAGTTFVSASNGGAYDPTAKQVTFTIGALAAGGTGTVSFVVAVDTSAQGGTILADAAALTATGNPTATAHGTAAVIGLPPPPPDAGAAGAGAAGSSGAAGTSGAAGAAGNGAAGSGAGNGGGNGAAGATGAAGSGAAGAAGAGAGGEAGNGAAGAGAAGASGAAGQSGAAGAGVGGHAGAGVGGHAGAGVGGHAGVGGAAGGAGSSGSSGGCGCAIARSPAPTDLVCLALAVGLLLASRRRKARR
jgi:uncharacterized repeat protein (TIGR01451 family)